jgi:hypothetical protein
MKKRIGRKTNYNIKSLKLSKMQPHSFFHYLHLHSFLHCNIIISYFIWITLRLRTSSWLQLKIQQAIIFRNCLGLGLLHLCQVSPLQETIILQYIIYNSITNLNYQHNPKYHLSKNPRIKKYVLHKSQNPLNYYILQ